MSEAEAASMGEIPTRKLPEGMKVDPSDPAYCDWRDKREHYTTASVPTTDEIGGEELFNLLSHRDDLTQKICDGVVSLLGTNKAGEFVINMCLNSPREGIQLALSDVAQEVGKNLRVVLVDAPL